ncbi:MAG: hypothetical protein AB8G22_14810, partial [Saprospiraceae bacterium]
MKNLLLLLATIFVFSNYTFSQNTYRVNNRPDTDADFMTIEDAIAEAKTANGNVLDIILVEGSLTSYSTSFIDVDTPIRIYGAGSFLADNVETQAYQEQSFL